MAKQNVAVLAFNRGEVSQNALARVDVEQLRYAAEEQVNWLPLSVGAMTIRPGLGYLGSTKSDAAAKLLPFVFGQDDTALLEFTDSVMRVWVDDALLTNVSVSTAVTNGDFSSSAGWTLSETAGSDASISGGSLSLHERALGSTAYAEREVAVSASDQNKVHRLRIVVTRGPVGFMVGPTSGTDTYVAKVALGPGTHSIAFTPTGNFFPRLYALDRITAVVDSITVESSGTFELTSPYAAANLADMRWAQSGDVVYVACEGLQQRQIERRDNNSWSIVLFEPTGGPYQSKPVGLADVKLRPVMGSQGVGGTGTLVSNIGFFSSDDVNSIIALETTGSNFRTELAGSDVYTEVIEINGATTEDRQVSISLGNGASGAWVGTLSIEISTVGPDEGFVEVATRTNNAGLNYDDSADRPNLTVWLRVGFRPGAYTSGSVEVRFQYFAHPRQRCQARLITLNSTTEMAAEWFERTRADGAFLNYLWPDWRLADWSHRVGWPNAVDFHDGRLWWGGRDKMWGSVSDDYTNHDEEFEGDAGPINRSFGYGPFARVNWIMSLGRLLVGRESSIASIRSSNFDAPITPTDYTVRDCSPQGAARLPAVKLGTRGIFVENSGRRVYEIAYNVDTQDYDDRDLTRLNSDIGLEGFAAIAAQRQPDTRVHLVRGDGMVAVLGYEPKEGIECWWRIETDGEIEDVVVLPGDIEDQVYFVVKRTINGSTKRYVEKMARLDECTGSTLCKLADAFVSVSQASSTTITGLSHLEGEEVVVWANGKDLGNYTVASGAITVSEAITTAIVGLEYEARFKGAKLAYAAQFGTALTQKKKLDHVGLVLTDTHYQGLEHSGVGFDRMDNLPLVEGGAETAAHTVWSEYDVPMLETPGGWSTDSRLYLRATAPRPCTVAAAVAALTTHEKY